jgi:periplasmic protein TonB
MQMFSRLVILLCLLLSGLAIGNANAQQPDPPPAKRIARVRQGGNITAKMLKYKVQPEYPEEAKEKGIAGTVRLHVIIARDGSVGQIELISGHPLLAKSAIEAVRQWKYRSTLLNGDPVEVDTTIDVIFSLNH